MYQNMKKCDNMSVAIDATVSECIREGILERFLTSHRAEVKNMLNKGVITVEQAAEELGITADDVEEKMSS